MTDIFSFPSFRAKQLPTAVKQIPEKEAQTRQVGEDEERQEATVTRRREREVCLGNARMRKHPIFGPVTASLLRGLKTHTHTLRQVCACSVLYVLKSVQPNSTFQSLLPPFHHVSREHRIGDDREGGVLL